MAEDTGRASRAELSRQTWIQTKQMTEIQLAFGKRATNDYIASIQSPIRNAFSDPSTTTGALRCKGHLQHFV